jgi:protein SCO1/2
MDIKLTAPHTAARHLLRAFAILLFAALAGCSSQPQPHWRLTNITGHMPDLKFQLTNDSGKAVTGADYLGKITMLYFGYTHCPDVCPLTMTRMHIVMQKLGPLAKDVRFLFVTVDPDRDTVPVLHQYVTAFDKHAVGLTGSHAEIAALTKRYRADYSKGKVKPDGSYEMNHSSAIYIFDRKGHARLLATPTTSTSDMVHDLHLLITIGKNAS